MWNKLLVGVLLVNGLYGWDESSPRCQVCYYDTVDLIWNSGTWVSLSIPGMISRSGNYEFYFSMDVQSPKLSDFKASISIDGEYNWARPIHRDCGSNTELSGIFYDSAPGTVTEQGKCGQSLSQTVYAKADPNFADNNLGLNRNATDFDIHFTNYDDDEYTTIDNICVGWFDEIGCDLSHTFSPTESPTSATVSPTKNPTTMPTPLPTIIPTVAPTPSPTQLPGTDEYGLPKWYQYEHSPDCQEDTIYLSDGRDYGSRTLYSDVSDDWESNQPCDSCALVHTLELYHPSGSINFEDNVKVELMRAYTDSDGIDQFLYTDAIGAGNCYASDGENDDDHTYKYYSLDEIKHNSVCRGGGMNCRAKNGGKRTNMDRNNTGNWQMTYTYDFDTKSNISGLNHLIFDDSFDGIYRTSVIINNEEEYEDMYVRACWAVVDVSKPLSDIDKCPKHSSSLSESSVILLSVLIPIGCCACFFGYRQYLKSVMNRANEYHIKSHTDVADNPKHYPDHLTTANTMKKEDDKTTKIETGHSPWMNTMVPGAQFEPAVAAAAPAADSHNNEGNYVSSGMSEGHITAEYDAEYGFEGEPPRSFQPGLQTNEMRGGETGELPPAYGDW